jgi:hypothetical protein
MTSPATENVYDVIVIGTGPIGQLRPVVAVADARRVDGARQAVTGPDLPELSGLAEARPWTNREATDSHTVPGRVVGGGGVGVEMASAWHGGGVAPLGYHRGRRAGPDRAALARRPLLPVHQRSMAPPP